MSRRKRAVRKHDRARQPERARASWRGMLRFGLVAFPVEAINASSPEEATIVLHQLHAGCHSRIRYQKTCPVHGPVDHDEIVSGFEFRKGQYVEIEPEELDDLRTDGERSLSIDAFISPDELDPIYLDGRMYYLSPDGEQAREPYAVFLAALENQDRWGIGQVVFSGKQQLAAVRPYRQVLHMAMLNYAAEIRESDDVVPPVPEIAGADKKVRLAEQLITSWTEGDFDLASYKDEYRGKVRELIEAKVEGREVVVPEAEEEPEVINLMDALRKSIGKKGTPRAAHRNGKAHPGERGTGRPAKRRRAS